MRLVPGIGFSRLPCVFVEGAPRGLIIGLSDGLTERVLGLDPPRGLVPPFRGLLPFRGLAP